MRIPPWPGLSTQKLNLCDVAFVPYASDRYILVLILLFIRGEIQIQDNVPFLIFSQIEPLLIYIHSIIYKRCFPVAKTEVVLQEIMGVGYGIGADFAHII